MSAIEVNNLVKKFHGQTVFHSIDLEVKPGGVVAIIGPSGSGKITLLRSINLLEQPEAGTIKVGNIVIDTACPLSQQKGLIRQLRPHVGFVFQIFNLFSHSTVLENIIEGPVIVKRELKADTIALANTTVCTSSSICTIYSSHFKNHAPCIDPVLSPAASALTWISGS